MGTAPPFLTPPANTSPALSLAAGESPGSQCFVVHDGPRDIHIIVVPSAPAESPRDSAPPIAAAPAAGPRVVLDGQTTARRTHLQINGHLRTLQDCRFVVFLRFVLAHLLAPGSWTSREALGLGRTRNTTTYIREAFAGLVPAGFDVIEGDRRGRFRLNPALVLDAIAWDALLEHPDPAVRNVVAAHRRRQARR